MFMTTQERNLLTDLDILLKRHKAGDQKAEGMIRRRLQDALFLTRQAATGLGAIMRDVLKEENHG
jgi:hypothetical protein